MPTFVAELGGLTGETLARDAGTSQNSPGSCATTPVPDQPAVPTFVAELGGRAGETSARDMSTLPALSNLFPQAPIVSTTTTVSGQASDKDGDGYDDHSAGHSIHNL